MTTTAVYLWDRLDQAFDCSEHMQAWRMRSGSVNNQEFHGRNPHPDVAVRQRNLNYWNFCYDHGTGPLICYDIMRHYKRNLL